MDSSCIFEEGLTEAVMDHMCEESRMTRRFHSERLKG